MVPTNSTTPDLHFVTSKLLSYEFEDDKELYRMASEVVQKLILVLVPVIGYVDQWIYSGLRGILIVNGDKDSDPKQLALSREGKWYARATSSGGWAENELAWTWFYFDEIQEGLKSAFAEALAKKEEHTKALTKRTELLKGIASMIEAASQK